LEAVVDELTGLAILIKRDLRDIGRGKTPDVPVAELQPARGSCCTSARASA